MNTYILPDGTKQNIYDMFISLCNYIETETYNSCTKCPLRDFCYNSQEKSIEEFGKEINNNKLGNT